MKRITFVITSLVVSLYVSSLHAAGVDGLVKGAVDTKMAEETGGAGLPTNPLGVDVPAAEGSEEEKGALDMGVSFTKGLFSGKEKSKKGEQKKRKKVSTENLQFRYDDRPITNPLTNQLQEAPHLEISRFDIQGIVDKPDNNITADGINAWAQEKLEKNANKMTIEQLDALVNEITLVYRKEGFIMARAFVPEQTVKNGVVKIIVREGFLEQTMFTGNELYSDKRLGYYFRHQVGEPVYKEDVERGLLLLSRYPGTRPTGLFVPGSVPGSSRLVIQTHEEDRFNGYLSLDNWGSEYTGENRFRVDANWNNPFGGADHINFLFQQTLSPANSTMLGFGYDRPIGRTTNGWASFLNPVFGDGLDLSLDYQTNDFDVGEELEDLDVNGDWTITSLAFNKHIITKKRTALNGLFEIAKKESSSNRASVGNEDKLGVLKYGVEFSHSDAWKGGGINYISLTMSKGLDSLGAMDSNGDFNSSRLDSQLNFVGGDFSKTNLVLQRLQLLPRKQTMLFKLERQSTSDLLVSLEQFPLGGIQTAPGYPVGEFLMDKVTRFTMELTGKSNFSGLEIPLNNLELTAYWVWAHGELNDPLPNDDAKAVLSTLGGRAVFNPFPKVDAQFDLAFPLGDPEPSNENSVQIYFSFAYKF